MNNPAHSIAVLNCGGNANRPELSRAEPYRTMQWKSAIRDECCIPYLDDVLCYARSFEEHVETICCVLKALQCHGVKLKPEKCEMFRSEVRYVGRLVSSEGVRVDPRDLEAVQSLTSRTPQTVGDVRRLLGFLSYYRTFIQDFSRVAKPLYELLQAKPEAAKGSQYRSKVKGPQVPSRTPVEWTKNHQQTLERLIEMLVKPPVLAYPNFNLPFSLHTDASERGLGAILSATRWEVEGHRVWVQDIDDNREELQVTQW